MNRRQLPKALVGGLLFEAALALLLPLAQARCLQDSQGFQDPASIPAAEQQAAPPFTIQVQRNIVLVRVVVRDSQGRLVPGLHQEDFKLLDNGRPQQITQFSSDTATSKTVAPPAVSPPLLAACPQADNLPPPAISLPHRYLALYFDDLNMKFDDVVYARDAAEKYLRANLGISERAAIFTASGTVTLDFTADFEKLHDGLAKLAPGSRVDPRLDCPQITDYEADRIVNYEDVDAYALVFDEAVNRCQLPTDMGSPVSGGQVPTNMVTKDFMTRLARTAQAQYEHQAMLSLNGLEQVIRRLSKMPGQRNLILISSGFMPMGRTYVTGQIIDRALRSQVVISSLDPRGLANVAPEGDASRAYMPAGRLGALMGSFARAREDAATAVLAQVAEGTGGEYFHDNNDLNAGFQKVAAPADAYYVLAFSPDKLKYNGAFHKLKVELADKRDFSVQARKGYFAPKKRSDAGTETTDEIQSVAFSPDESVPLPMQLCVRVAQSDGANARLSVLTLLDVRSLQFRKEKGRNLNDLTFVTVIYDPDGHYVAGQEKKFQLQFSDATLAKIVETGVGVETSFDVKPGAYVVRELVRDSLGGQVSSRNRPVAVPN